MNEYSSKCICLFAFFVYFLINLCFSFFIQGLKEITGHVVIMKSTKWISFKPMGIFGYQIKKEQLS